MPGWWKQAEVSKGHGHCPICEINSKTRGKSDIKDHFQFANFRDGEMEYQRNDFSDAL